MTCSNFAARATRPACLRLVPLCLVILAVGCSHGASVDTAEVTGKVTYKGQPLPGGRITFLTTGGFAHQGVIDENGNYTVNAPRGDVLIGIDNRMLQGRSRGPGKQPILRAPGSEEPVKMKGHYVALPSKYYSPQDSGLTYNVQQGTQTKDFNLE
jgi:hypothetical protein